MSDSKMIGRKIQEIDGALNHDSIKLSGYLSLYY